MALWIRPCRALSIVRNVLVSGLPFLPNGTEEVPCAGAVAPLKRSSNTKTGN